MRSRGIAVVLALLLAAGATAAVFLYVQSVKKDAGTTIEDGIRVVVAKEDIRGGTNLDTIISAGGFTTLTLPRNAVIQGAVTDLAQLQHRTTTSFIAAGEQITTKRLSGSETPTGGVLNIPEGFQALTLSMDTERHVAGFVSQGDHIQLFAALKSGQTTITVTVVPDVVVLKVGTSPSTGTSTTDTTANANFLTIALTPKDAAKVIEARENGNVWFTLLPPSQTGVHVNPIDVNRLLK